MPQPRLLPGDAAPWFVVRSVKNPRFHFDTTAGRYLLLYFAGSLASESGKAVERALLAQAPLFNGVGAAVFLISADPADEQSGRQQKAGIKYFWDFGRDVARLYGLADEQMPLGVRPALLLIDRDLRILTIKALSENALADAETFIDMLRRQPPAQLPSLAMRQAPVLVVERIFEPTFCRMLIDVYNTQGSVDSGYMQQVDGRTVGVIDYGHKRRQDCVLTDDKLIDQCRTRITRRLAPEIKKAFQFEVTRIERFLVAGYDAKIGGYFRSHRDNTTSGTAHRRFAVTINLNAEEYEGGDLRFPEYGPQYYRAPTGGAVVFSCSLLHEALPVTRGVRYAYLPFLYDEEGARIREQNAKLIDSRTMKLDDKRQPVPVGEAEPARG
ncbi:MAG: 2OG-Fe(II) oxygenase [Rhodospirillales bacterium]